MDEIHITLDLDDLKEVRENGHIVRDGVYFSHTTDIDVDGEYERLCTLSESTLYRNGVAHWTNDIIDTGEPEVHVTFEQPTLEELVAAEIEHVENQYDENLMVEQEEWLDGQLYQLTNIKEFLE